MNYLKLLFGLLICSNFVLGQSSTYEVVYSKQVFFEINDSLNYSKEKEKALRLAMQEKRLFSLITNTSESIYKSIPSIANSQNESGFKVSFSESENAIYKNLIDSISIVEETYPAQFMIYDSLNKYNWKLIDEEKIYKGYRIRKAETLYSDVKLVAWYTSEIPINSGPEYIWGLPGLILIVESSRLTSTGKQLIRMESLHKTDEIEIRKPKIRRNNYISRKEFEVLLRDFIKKENEMLGIGVDTYE